MCVCVMGRHRPRPAWGAVGLVWGPAVGPCAPGAKRRACAVAGWTPRRVSTARLGPSHSKAIWGGWGAEPRSGVPFCQKSTHKRGCELHSVEGPCCEMPRSAADLAQRTVGRRSPLQPPAHWVRRLLDVQGNPRLRSRHAGSPSASAGRSDVSPTVGSAAGGCAPCRAAARTPLGLWLSPMVGKATCPSTSVSPSSWRRSVFAGRRRRLSPPSSDAPHRVEKVSDAGQVARVTSMRPKWA